MTDSNNSIPSHYLDQLQGFAEAYPALRRLYESIENVKSEIIILVKSINTAKCTPSPNRGGLHKMANSIELLSKGTQQFADDSDKVIDSSGNLSGDFSPAVNDINQLANYMNNFAKSIRIVAADRDYYRGDFDGVENGLQDLANSLEHLAAVIGRANAISKLAFDVIINATQVNEGISDLQQSITAWIRSIKRFLKKCGKNATKLGYIIKGLAAFNKGMGELKDAF